MNETDLARVFATFTMLGVASYYDLKSREVNDMVWIVFGVIGAVLYVFDAPSFSVNVIATGFGLYVAFLCWRLQLCGGADVLSLVTLSVILPTYRHIPATVAVWVIGLTIAFSYAIMSNIYRNLRTYIAGQELFAEFDDSWYKKLAAFFLIHKRTEGEKYGFAAEAVIDGKRKFIFKHKIDSETFGNERYVTAALPTMPFLLVGLVFFVAISVI